jgi:hypothetical protein
MVIPFTIVGVIVVLILLIQLPRAVTGCSFPYFFACLGDDKVIFIIVRVFLSVVIPIDIIVCITMGG